MADDTDGKPLLERYRVLDAQARQSWAQLNRSPKVAATAVYDLRLALRVSRILKRFIRKDPGFAAIEGALDRCYQATARVRDQQVELDLVRLLEQDGSCRTRPPSKAMKARLLQETRQLEAEVAQLGLSGALQGMDQAYSSLQRRRSEEQMQCKALRQARRFEVRMCERMHDALLGQADADWHALRLAIKHYRFWVLTLADWLPPAYSEQVNLLKPLQVALGNYHDWVVLEARLPELEGAPMDRWLPEVLRFKQASLELARAQLEPLLKTF